jgi:hypothetical protein
MKHSIPVARISFKVMRPIDTSNNHYKYRVSTDGRGQAKAAHKGVLDVEPVLVMIAETE